MSNAVLPMNSLPPLNMSDPSYPHYRMHFRIVSEDRNRNTHWSHIMRLEPASVPIVAAGAATKPLTLNVSNTADSINAAWNESVFMPNSVSQPKTGQLKFCCTSHELQLGQRVAISCAGNEILGDSQLLGHPIVESISNYITVQTPGFKLNAETAADFTVAYRLPYRTLDLYYKWSNSNWIYAGRSTPNDSITIRRVSGATTIDLAWQRITNPTIRYDDGVSSSSPVTAYVYQHTIT